MLKIILIIIIFSVINVKWNRFLNKTIVRVFHGLKPEDEDGIIYDYSEYNYD